MRVSTDLFPVGTIIPDVRYGLGNALVIVVDSAGNTVPFVHGGFMSRELYPELVEAVGDAYPDWETDEGIFMPDFRDRVIVQDLGD